MQTQQKKEEANVSTVCPNGALKTSKEERDITRGKANDINNNFSSSSDCNLFKLN